jgi:hypothetical protein
MILSINVQLELRLNKRVLLVHLILIVKKVTIWMDNVVHNGQIMMIKILKNIHVNKDFLYCL